MKSSAAARKAPESSRSRTTRPLTKKYCDSAFGLLKVGRPTQPEMRMPSRAASTLSASATNASPSAWRSRSRSPASPAGQAGQSNAPPRSLMKEKRTPGLASARRRTTSAQACASARSDLRNFSRAGVAANRSRASTRVPAGWDMGRSALFAPSSTASANAASAPWARLRISSRDTEAIDGSASPRKPSVAMVGEIAVGNLRGRVALDRKREIVGVHAGAVVGDADQRRARPLRSRRRCAARRRRARSRSAP